jgi:acetoin utilization deacetylase AcuC-like enzyme
MEKARRFRRTGYCFDEAGMWHDTGSCCGWEPASFNPAARSFLQPLRHFENAEAKRRCHSLLQVCGLCRLLLPVVAESEDVLEASDEDLLLVHTQRHIDEISEAARKDHSRNVGECTVVSSGSAVIARRAVGCVIRAVDAVMDERLENAYVLCRPPGHHAEPDQARGFCLFNNVAVAAAHLIERRQLRRVAVVDFDVHHGNGTEKIFYSDPRVLVISIHQDNLYPLGSGAMESRGAGAGEGFNMNIPVPPGSGIGCYDAILERVILPALAVFDPEFVLLSAGYDACSFDPLSHTMLSSGSYSRIASSIAALASKITSSCRGRIVAVHEGGYSEVYAPFCFLRVIEGLLGIDAESSAVQDPYEAEIVQYAFQELQPHQEAVVLAAEGLVGQLAAIMRSQGGSPN